MQKPSNMYYNSNSNSDSDTSTASLCDEEKYQVEDLKSKLQELLIKPVTGTELKYFNQNNNSEILVNDNFEISLLRFMHLIFSNDGVVLFENLTKYMDLEKKECQELYEYFRDFPGVMVDSDFYKSITGIQIRQKWFAFLSNRNFLAYKNLNYELVPCMKNVYSFFDNFFPKLLYKTSNNEQEQLSNIYTQLNFNYKSINIVYSTYQKIENDFIHSSSIQNIIIDGIELYIWEISRVTFMNLNELFSNSELRFS